MIEAVIFDMDGVLIDSIPSAQKARKRLFAEYGIDFYTLPDPHGEEHKGSSLKSLLKVANEIYPNITISFAKFSKKQTRGVYDDLIERKLTADKALIILLDDLKKHKIPMAVASASLREAVHNKLNILNLTSYFDVIVSADDVKDHKPNPASYLLTMQKLNVSPRKCIIFEDSSSGVEAGHKAGAKVIGFTKYNNDKKALAHTDITVDDWNDISYERMEQLVV
jgi:HAD superfamily hydrolase (TIGR01509 family)